MQFFEELQQIKELTSRTSEAMGGVYSDPFNEIATVISVSDPKKLGRVKVEYQDGTTSDWVYVLGSGKGLLSAQLIGTSCLIGKAHGNSNDAFVLGFFNKNPNVATGGGPVQIPTIDEQANAYRSPQSPGDQGLRCNRGNSGRIYLLENEMNQDVVVCIRRNNSQQGGEEVWNWKSLTNSKWVEKGFDPGLPKPKPIVTDYSEKKGIPKCSPALENDVRDFTEDRKFRTYQIKCGKDENGDYNWKPVGATPIQVRTTLPECTEKMHGIGAVLDEGLNSQHVICLRYQGQMKWVNPGKREPIQFYKNEKPLSKIEFLESKKPMPELQSNSGMKKNDFVGNSIPQVLQMAAKAVPAALPTTPLGAALRVANALPGAFNGAQLLSDIAKTVIVNNGTLPVDSLVSQISSALNSAGVIDDTTQAVLSTLGGAGSQLLRGVENNTVDDALENIGRNALNQSIRALSPEASSVYFGYMAGGIAGALDAASVLNLSQIPEEINSIIAPALAIGADVLRSQPQAINKVMSSATGAPGSSTLGETLKSVQSIAQVTPGVISGVTSAIESGDLGEIASTLSSFSSIPGMPKLAGAESIPQIASTALQTIGLGKQLLDTFKGGISLDSVGKLLQSNPVAGLLGGLASGLFGGGGGDCPCSPKCRKTKHFEDSDGNNLLEPCGNVVANSSSAYSPNGIPTQNNQNEVAESLGRITTLVGEELCVPNTWDLTEMIQDVKRLGEMAERMNSAKDADWPELWSEFIYTFETIEKAFKKTDNNITKVESIERKLIDAQYRLINRLLDGNQSFMSQTLLSIVTTSKAIRDVYNYVKKLDAKKKGGTAGVRVTDSLSGVFENIVKIATLNSTTKKEAVFITNKFLKTADSEWKDLNPAKKLVSLSDFVLGLVPKDLPATSGKCRTKNNSDKVLKDSLESKLNSPAPNDPQSLFAARLPSIESRRSDTTPTISSLLDEIAYEQGRSQSGEADC